MKIKYTTFCLSILLILIFTSCNSSKEKVNDEPKDLFQNTVMITDEQLKNISLEVGNLEDRLISSTLKVNGKIDVPPQNMVSISIPLGGYLKSSALLPGMHVRKGEIIAVLEDQQYISIQQDYLTAKAKLIYAEAEFNRQKELNVSKASSDKLFQQAQSDYTTQKILVKSLSEKLKLIGINPDRLDENNLSRSINILSPIDGFVSKVNVNIGKYANPADVLFEIVNPTDIHLALTIFEKDIEKISIGQKLFAYSNSKPDKKYLCEIILIGKDLTNDHSVEVHCHFEQYDKNLIPGMFMNADIELVNKHSLTLPNDAIVNFNAKDFLFVQLNKNNFEMIEVEIGNTENNYSEIICKNIDSLSNKNIVTKGAYSLLMQLKNKE
jgi:cobalt-zinc-cadmium efflux system membrane fusion protein